MNPDIADVPLKRAYRLINHGPTVLVSARHGGIDNVMAAAWCCGLDYDPPKLTVVIAQGTKTRELVEKSGAFAIQVPTVRQLHLTDDVGTHSMLEDPGKLPRFGVKLFAISGYELPFVEGCSAWLACKLVPEPHNQDAYDLFIGEVVGAWADQRVFKDGRWLFETADPGLRSLHHVAGGHYYAVGEGMSAKTR